MNSPLPDSLPRYSLLDPPLLIAQATAFGLPPESVERLVAIDRILRSVAAADLMGPDAIAGWALAGPTALHGVYLRSGPPLRVPDALVLAPIAGREPMAPETLAALLATALPGGQTAATGEAGLWTIGYAGTAGAMSLPLRLEIAPLAFEAPLVVRGAERAEVGYLYDRRMPYLPRVASTPVAVPVAYAEELILRLLGALAAPGNRSDIAARVDDLRLLLALEASDTRDALAGPVHGALVTGLRQRGLDAGAIKSRLDAIGSAIAGTVARWSDPGALPAGLRPTTTSYGPAERRAFETALDGATSALTRGSR